MSYTVEFLGGPLDGERRHYPAPSDGTYPPTIEIKTMTPVAATLEDLAGTPGPNKVPTYVTTYYRTARIRDDALIYALHTLA